MLPACGCMCEMAGHYGICQVAPEPGRRHISRNLSVTPGAEVCQACFDAVVRTRLDRRDVLARR